MVFMKLSDEMLAQSIQAKDINDLTPSALQSFFTEELTSFLPRGIAQIDPRDEMPIIFNEARANRPHDNDAAKVLNKAESCVICEGKITGVIDLAEISSGHTFINKNLYPVVFPLSAYDHLPQHARTVRGYHFLQWTSTQHELDWHNMSLDDLVVVINRLAALEKWLLQAGPDLLKSPAESIYVSIGKNFGRLVGGSLVHGHQQIAVTNLRPRRIREHIRFQQIHGEVFSQYMLAYNDPLLTVRAYPTARLVVPYFMPRPYQMMLLPEESGKVYLYQLELEERRDICRGWQDAIRLMRTIMPEMGRDVAYNVITHNGPGAGLYFEFLPYTQETGCFERMGLYVCQNEPLKAAENLRKGLGCC